VLGEVHARPFLPVAAPARVLHFAFITDHAAAERDRAALAGFCQQRGVAPPPGATKHHAVSLGDSSLRWEQHGEFTTYTWEFPAQDHAPFMPAAGHLGYGMGQLPQPGPHLCSIDLHILPVEAAPEPAKLFDAASLCHSEVDAGSATLSTDLKPGADGFIRLLIATGSNDPARIGALAQRCLEIETYRTLALLGLPEAQRMGPAVRAIETELADITSRMTGSQGLADNEELLHRLTQLAARLEADAASSLFRFGATRAYDEIMRGRLDVIREQPVAGRSTLEAFLSRRHGPAMRTCQAIVDRQVNLSTKLARATQLLRSRVEVEIEQQNRDVLAAMNERTRLQLRLQQTVEGLSTAAISYYIVGLVSYMSKASKELGLGVNPDLITAVAVPVVIVGVFALVRRLRRTHLGG
jgi:uncharacterized membrane-anchored protein